MVKDILDTTGGVQVFDTAGNLIPAGNYVSNDWQKLANNNPALAEALIQHRQAQSDAINAQQAKRTSDAIALGTITGTGVAAAVGRDRAHKMLGYLHERYSQTLSPMQSYYAGSRVAVTGTAPGVMEVTVDGGVNAHPRSKVPTQEIKEAKRSFSEFTQTPEGRKLYQAVAYDENPAKAARKAKFYESIGFSPAGKDHVMRMDLRPGANRFGAVYKQGDKLMLKLAKNPETAARLGLAGIGLGAAAATAGAIRGAYGLINPLEDV